MDGHSASQIPHLPSPLSQLSEPPDIRNWFSSYKYESFVLDTYEFVGGGGVFNESGHDGDGCVAVEEGNKEKGEDLDECTREGSSGDEMHEDPSVTETPDSLYPSPPFFEPPHIRNWFTSYVPETPTLDSLDDLKEYVPIESECAKDETVVEVSGKEREENFDELRKSSDCNEVGADENPCLNGLVTRKDSFSDACGNKALSENLDASQSSSFLSEPPDIRNWFPSYVYKTPELSESIGFPVDKKDFEEDDCANQCSNKEKVQSNGLPKSDICLGEDEQDKQSINEGNRAVGEEKLPTPETSCCEMKRSFEDWTQTNNGISPTKDIEKSSFNDGDTPCKKQENHKLFLESGYTLLEGNKRSSYEGRTSPAEVVIVQDTTENIETRARSETDIESNDKENVGKGVSGEGFVTVKRRNDTNPKNRSEVILQESSRNKRTTSSSGTEKDVAAKRKVLSERTNLDNLSEVTGKWKCPQKSKPNVGPPMKQLRLERWVHRVNDFQVE